MCIREREPDYDSHVWTDWEEGSFGQIADQEDVYPDGFMWTCCDEPGDAGGCRNGPYVEKEYAHKRPKC